MVRRLNRILRKKSKRRIHVDDQHIIDDFIHDQVRHEPDSESKPRKQASNEGLCREEKEMETMLNVTLDLSNEGEESLMNTLDVNNKSSENILVTQGEQQGDENAEEMREKSMLKLYIYWKNIEERKFMDVSPGVFVCPINDCEGFLRFNPDCACRTSINKKDLTLIVHQGSLLISLNNTLSLHNEKDIIHIPNSKLKFYFLGSFLFKRQVASIFEPKVGYFNLIFMAKLGVSFRDLIESSILTIINLLVS